jgi:signal transduction histidine kinase
MALFARWWRRRSLRARLTIVTSAGLAVTLCLATLVLLYALRASLTRGLDDSARQAAVEVAALVDGNRLPDPVPVGSGTITIQVLDAQGRITDVSPGADRLVPILSPADAAAAVRTGQGRMLAGAPLGMPSLLRVVAVGANDHQIVIAAVSFAQVNDSLSTLGEALALGVPALFVLLALVTWLVTGYALRPIAALSRGAARVTATGVPHDLPVPPARDEVRSLAVTLNDMLSRLADAQQRQRDLVSDTAHELRSPISSIRTQLEVALDHPDSQDWAETARDVYADTLRLTRLAEDLLLLARLEEPTPRPRTIVDLAALSRSAAERCGTARVPVVVNAPSPCLLPGDPASLDRLLVNLIDNAVRYARKQVTVTTWHEGQWAELTVTDDGPGIHPEDTERAFGRFARLDDARSRDGVEAGGAGLGLAIVRATAQAHGGSARLESAHPGLQVVVRLPCPAGAGGSDGGSAEPGAGGHGTSQNPG